jgi:hypothetical protein
VTLTPGQTFYEGPDDVHVVDRNASGTQPARFLVLLIKDKGAPGAHACAVTVTQPKPEPGIDRAFSFRLTQK